jgi:arginine decarboxylase
MTHEILVTTGVGFGSTKVSAFDAALWDAGVGNYNLILLSFVIPAGTSVRPEKANLNAVEIGWKLYYVQARADSVPDGPEGHAGLIWGYDILTGGVFLEGSSRSRDELSRDLDLGFHDMAARRQLKASPSKVVVGTGQDRRYYRTALVIALFDREPWDS